MHVQATLTYSPYQLGAGSPIPIGSTDNEHLLRLFKKCLLAEAERREQLWRSADPVVGRIMIDEAQRLEHLLSNLIPDDVEDEGPNGSPGLHLVGGEK